ncbi:anti-sigma factor family protein [Methylopila sp. Yamaguchi]|uniref:anti-sigma factor family protein n=1 Tax=Methylopila sp. Yamaguchi TaxID=1437817 RepID=UPI000CA997A1|nr:anti-sigma factor [Methylopila sp. Yamaguchi]GBD49848.1 transmembrane anti-sigma factor [Methylopila sp. Yamaguchi]
MTARPISEDDLQAYVDDALPDDRRRYVSAYLAANPDVADRVRRLSEQRDQLREAYAPVLREPVPPELNLGRIVAARRQPRFASWRSVAAAVALLALGGGGGWIGRGLTQPTATGVTALALEASQSFTTYASDHGRPVELRAADSAELVAWMSKRLNAKVTAPDLTASGYRFMGGRIVPTAHGPAGMFMYDDDRGQRLVMLMRPMASSGDAPMSEHEIGRIGGVAWARAGMGYSLVGDAAPKDIHPLADVIRDQTPKI